MASNQEPQPSPRSKCSAQPWIGAGQRPHLAAVCHNKYVMTYNLTLIILCFRLICLFCALSLLSVRACVIHLEVRMVTSLDAIRSQNISQMHILETETLQFEALHFHTRDGCCQRLFKFEHTLLCRHLVRPTRATQKYKKVQRHSCSNAQFSRLKSTTILWFPPEQVGTGSTTRAVPRDVDKSAANMSGNMCDACLRYQGWNSSAWVLVGGAMAVVLWLRGVNLPKVAPIPATLQRQDVQRPSIRGASPMTR